MTKFVLQISVLLQMKVKSVIYTIFACVIVLSCKGKHSSKQSSTSSAPADSVEFKMVKVPSVFTEQSEIFDYTVEHFWDNLNANCYSNSLEQAFANWVWLSDNVSVGIAGKSLVSAYEKSPEKILYLADKYLYNPQSPYRNEDIYGILCARAGGELASVASLCALNAVGSKAADFRIEDARGRQYTLYGVKANYTLLFFSNPYCNACKEIIDTLKGDALIAEALDKGILAVVNMYTDEDLDQWRSYLAAYPKKWHTGFDPTFTLQNREKYNIRAIPSLYLLSADKTVLLKDAPTEKVMGRLQIELQRYL